MSSACLTRSRPLSPLDLHTEVTISPVALHCQHCKSQFTVPTSEPVSTTGTSGPTQQELATNALEKQGVLDRHRPKDEESQRNPTADSQDNSAFGSSGRAIS